MAVVANGRYARAVQLLRTSSVQRSPIGARLARSLALVVIAGGVAAGVAAQEPKQIPGGAPLEVRGEVVEMGCYLRDGSRGEGHRTCALSCLKNGGQLGIVADDSGELYPLAGATPASDPSAAAREHVAAHVAVRGRLFERAGSRVLVVEELTRLSP